MVWDFHTIANTFKLLLTSCVNPCSTSDREAVQNLALAPASEGNKWTLWRTLGTGGHARVHKIVQRPSGRTLAFKTFRHGHEALSQCTRGERAVRRRAMEDFKYEFEILSSARLRHPHIVRAEFLVEDETRFTASFALELLDGNLYDLYGEITEFAHAGRFPESIAFAVWKQIASALAHLERMGMAHRDLKPDNILFSHLAPVPGSGSGSGPGDASETFLFKLADFAFATPCTSRRYRCQYRGIERYTAPEIMAADPAPEPRSDVWSLWAVVLELLDVRGYGTLAKSEREYAVLAHAVQRAGWEERRFWYWRMAGAREVERRLKASEIVRMMQRWGGGGGGGGLRRFASARMLVEMAAEWEMGRLDTLG